MSDDWLGRVKMPKFYILDADHHVVESTEKDAWAWRGAGNGVVAKTDISDDVEVSTVFLTLDHRLSFDDSGPPILFETMVFGGEMDDEVRRYSSWDDAVIGHEAMVRKVKAAEANKKPADSGGA